MIAATAHLVRVGTRCFHVCDCVDQHKDDLALFFKEYPGEYEHLEIFMHPDFITSTFFMLEVDSALTRQEQIELQQSL